jgi:cation efflux system protein involved in nickel and cobalt tolerance
MLNRVIRWSVENRLVVLVLAGFLIYFGIRAARQSPLDVFPDFAPPQVIIQTEAQGLSPEEVEQLVSLPLENALNGTPDLETIRSSSAAGLSVVTCIFTSGTDIFRARQLVAEKLQQAQALFPNGIGQPQMMPISVPVGILIKISLTSDTASLMDLRTLADWTIRPRLLAVPGVAQVTTFGGGVKQYQVIVNPAELQNHNVTLAEVKTAAAQANQNAGAGFMDSPGQSLVIHGLGRVHSVEDLEQAVIAVKNGVPVLIRDIASVRLAPEYKIGDASTFGKPSVILIVNKQPTANTLTATRAVEAALSEMRSAFPPGVVMDTDLFRQADFIETAISNINSAMLEGGLLVVLVLLLFLTTWRAGFISLTAIPLSLLVAVVVMRWLGATINSMTLGGLAIAIGAVVDDAIIDVENVFRRLRENRLKPKPDPILDVIFRASVEVRTSILYATIIIALVFLPIFSLSGLAGRIFAPLGYAYIIAILASLVVALTVTPALCFYLLPKAAGKSEDSFLVRRLKRLFQRNGLDPALHHPKTVIAFSAVLLLGAVAAVPFLGGEFLPDFNEGNLILHMTGLPGTSLEESMRVGKIVQARLAEIPETVKAAQQAGRAELGEDTSGPYYSELVVKLKESDRPRDEVMADVRSKLKGIKGYTFGIQQFISERIEEVLSGTTATVAVKVFGPDLDRLQQIGQQIQSVMASVPGVADLALEQQTGVPQVSIQFNRQALALHGLTSTDLADTLQTAFYGTEVSDVVEQQKTFAILVRYDPEFAADVETMRRTRIDTPQGGRIPLGSVADIRIVNGPNVINRENAQRRAVVSCNISSGSLTGVVEEIRRRVDQSVKLPTGYYIVYGGQYEAQTEAVDQMTVLGIGAVIGIFMLLFLAFRSMRQALLVMANLPLALIGGVAAVLLFSEGELSIASLVGFVTLFGIATRNGIMLVTHYNHLMDEEGMPFGRELVVRGAMERLSPILMTALVAGLALLPLALSEGKSGRELEQPMAVVILGGLLTSTLLNMIVLPALYLKFGKPRSKQPLEPGGEGMVHV